MPFAAEMLQRKHKAGEKAVHDLFAGLLCPLQASAGQGSLPPLGSKRPGRLESHPFMDSMTMSHVIRILPEGFQSLFWPV